jgi:pimeloyl-ACP methyl ester carboxylesterase
VGRQLVAIAASGDRTAALRSLSLPALVIHGADDPLVGLSGGRATAAAIPRAELVVYDGMGHHLPPALYGEIARRLAGLALRADRERAVRPQ